MVKITHEPIVSQVHRQTSNVIREPGARLQKFDFSQVEARLTPTKILHFRDDGQDFLHWYLAANGVVVCSEPYQSHVWAGYVVIQALVGKEPIVRDYDGHTKKVKHRIDRIEHLNKGEARGR